jgi:CRP-like cAMP-binding protein
MGKAYPFLSFLIGQAFFLLTIEKVAILKSTDIFAQTPDHILASVAAIAEEITLEAGETFIHQDTFEDDMYIIIEGEVRVHSGEETIAVLEAGQVIGEMEVLSPAPRLASATTTTETRLLGIHKDAFDEVMADRPEIAQRVIQVLVRRLRAVVERQRPPE